MAATIIMMTICTMITEMSSRQLILLLSIPIRRKKRCKPQFRRLNLLKIKDTPKL